MPSRLYPSAGLAIVYAEVPCTVLKCCEFPVGTITTIFEVQAARHHNYPAASILLERRLHQLASRHIDGRSCVSERNSL